MTTRTKSYPTRVRVRKKNQAGQVIIDQIRTIDKRRIINRLDKLTSGEITKVKAVIKETFVDLLTGSAHANGGGIIYQNCPVSKLAFHNFS